MKGFMVLEYPFKMLLYLVVIVVVIGIILFFRKEIMSGLNFCWIGGCHPEPCKTVRVNEASIDTSVLDKYCNLCWQKTGKIGLKEDCLCYVVSGSFTPFAYTSEHCVLKCNSNSQFVTFTYSHLFNQIFIEC